MYPFTELPTVFKKNYSVYFTRIHKKAVVSGFKSYIFNFMLLWLYMIHLKYLLKVYSVHSDILGNGTFRCEYLKPFSQGAHNGIGYSEYGVISVIMETCVLTQICVLYKNLRGGTSSEVLRSSWQSCNRSMWSGGREKQMSLKREADARPWKISCTNFGLHPADDKKSEKGWL